jgi:hypothetical protein
VAGFDFLAFNVTDSMHEAVLSLENGEGDNGGICGGLKKAA